LPALRSTPGALIWVILAPLFYAALSVSAKLAGEHLSVWQVGLGRFFFGLLLVPFIVKALGLSLWGQQRFLLIVRGLCGSVAFLPLSGFHSDPVSLGYRRAHGQNCLAVHLRRFHGHQPDPVAP